MRKWFASLAAVGLVTAAATAQSIPCIFAYQQTGYDNGVPSTGWKVNYPTLAGDRFSVDFDGDVAGANVVGLVADLWSTGPGGVLGQVAFCTSNFGVDSTGTTPDIVGGVVAGTTAPTGVVPNSSAGFCPGFVGIDLPDFTAGNDLHGVLTMATGDSVLWLCSDTAAPAGRTYFTTNSYTTTALPFSVNWMMRAAKTGTPGTYTINGVTAASVADNGFLSLEFWGTAGTGAYLQGIFIGSSFIPVPAFAIPTGTCNFAPGFAANSGDLNGNITGCPPVGTSVSFGAFFLDATNPKPNGHPKATLTNLASFTVTSQSKACCPLPCFGILDDGIVDATFWKVVYPSTGGDWISVKLGAIPAGVNNLLSTEVCCYDTGGAGGQFQSVGVYAANFGVDSTGNTLDPASPISEVTGAAASVPAAVSQWTFPGVTFDFADVAATTGSVVHLGVNWNSGDTVLWEASDSDGIDDPNASSPNDCGVIPNTTSFFTSNNFTSTAIPFTFANAMQRLTWN